MHGRVPPSTDRYRYVTYYPNTLSLTASCSHNGFVVVAELYRSRAERKLADLMRQLEGAKLASALRKQETNAKAMADRESRRRVKPARGAPRAGVRLFPYQVAMVARSAPRTRER